MWKVLTMTKYILHRFTVPSILAQFNSIQNIPVAWLLSTLHFQSPQCKFCGHSAIVFCLLFSFPSITQSSFSFSIDLPALGATWQQNPTIRTMLCLTCSPSRDVFLKVVCVVVREFTPP